MNEEKMKSLKESIYNDSLKVSLSKIEDKCNLYKDEENISNMDMANLSYDIQNYFYSISESLFDTFVSEGGSSDYSYKSFKTYYMPIFYSYLKDFFVNNPIIKNFILKLDKVDSSFLYVKCEDSLFNFISLYYFNPENQERSYAVENILNSIIEYDCDTKDKEERYKNILFRHFVQSKLNELDKEINYMKGDASLGQRTYTELRSYLKILKGRIYSGPFKYTPEEKAHYTEEITKTRESMRDLSIQYSESNQKLNKVLDRYYYYAKLTREEFESDEFLKNKEE